MVENDTRYMAIPGGFAVGFLCFFTRKWRDSHQKKLDKYYEKKSDTELEEDLRTEYKLKCYKKQGVLYFLDAMSLCLLFGGASLVIYGFESESVSLYGELLTLLKKRKSETGTNNPHSSNMKLTTSNNHFLQNK